MALYYMNEAMFELPPGEWLDDSVHIVASKAPDGERIGVTINRSRMQQGSTLRQLADAQEQTAARGIPAYKLLGKRDLTVGGLPAVETKYSFLHEDMIIVQRQISLAARGDLYVITGSAALAKADGLDPLMDSVVATLRFREA